MGSLVVRGCFPNNNPSLASRESHQTTRLPHKCETPCSPPSILVNPRQLWSTKASAFANVRLDFSILRQQRVLDCSDSSCGSRETRRKRDSSSIRIHPGPRQQNAALISVTSQT